MSLPDTTATRQAIIDACLWMGTVGVNQGTSGNVSVRVLDGMLITPSAVAYAAMTPDMICKVPLDGGPDPAGLKPSTEWRFHQAILQARPDVNAVVHAHPVHATAVSTHRRPIPAVHYMIAAFGGPDVPVTDYALFGSDTLARMVAAALAERDGCLLANHGAVTVAETLDRALWRMQELENLAKVYTVAKTSGRPVLLTDADIEEALASFADYGQK
ncbi:class II aldolase/adducin family protein [Yoonia sp. 2307UL14-13]|uniref:class II aldolase/adducin family protein n=1 Tax=Yoonia sp. 2307UL14-13 TaxID=3126506 RepID=UPI00309A1242